MPSYTLDAIRKAIRDKRDAAVAAVIKSPPLGEALGRAISRIQGQDDALTVLDELEHQAQKDEVDDERYPARATGRR